MQLFEHAVLKVHSYCIALLSPICLKSQLKSNTSTKNKPDTLTLLDIFRKSCAENQAKISWKYHKMCKLSEQLCSYHIVHHCM